MQGPYASFFVQSCYGKQVPQVFVTSKTGEGIGENRFQLAILEGYETFTREIKLERKVHEARPVDLLSASSLPRVNVTDRGSRKTPEFCPDLLR